MPAHLWQLAALAVWLLCQGLTAGPAAAGRARPEDDAITARARLYLEASVAYFNDGRYADAERGMLRAYELRPVPELQYNLAQCQERLGALDRAAASYRAYLKSRPDAADAPEVARRIAQLEDRLKAAASPAAASPPPSATATAAPPGPAGATTPAAASLTTAGAVSAAAGAASATAAGAASATAAGAMSAAAPGAASATAAGAASAAAPGAASAAAPGAASAAAGTTGAAAESPAGAVPAAPAPAKVIFKEIIVYKEPPPKAGRSVRIAGLSLLGLAAAGLATGIVFSVETAQLSESVQGQSSAFKMLFNLDIRSCRDAALQQQAISSKASQDAASFAPGNAAAQKAIADQLSGTYLLTSMNICNFFHIASDNGVLNTAGAVIGYAVAGLAVVGSVGMLLYARHLDRKQARELAEKSRVSNLSLLLTPYGGPAGAGLVLNGRF